MGDVRGAKEARRGARAPSRCCGSCTTAASEGRGHHADAQCRHALHFSRPLALASPVSTSASAWHAAASVNNQAFRRRTRPSVRLLVVGMGTGWCSSKSAGGSRCYRSSSRASWELTRPSHATRAARELLGSRADTDADHGARLQVVQAQLWLALGRGHLSRTRCACASTDPLLLSLKAMASESAPLCVSGTACSKHGHVLLAGRLHDEHRPATGAHLLPHFPRVQCVTHSAPSGGRASSAAPAFLGVAGLRRRRLTSKQVVLAFAAGRRLHDALAFAAGRRSSACPSSFLAPNLVVSTCPRPWPHKDAGTWMASGSPPWT